MKIKVKLVIDIFFYSSGFKKIVFVCFLEVIVDFYFFVSYYVYGVGFKDCILKSI